MVARPRPAPEDGSGSGSISQRFLERQRRRAERALRRHAADNPVRPPATGAVIDFTVVIDGVIAPRAGIECCAARRDGTEHSAFLRNHLIDATSGESLGFIDDPCLCQWCHSGHTTLFQSGTKHEEPFRRRDDRQIRAVDINHCLAIRG